MEELIIEEEVVRDMIESFWQIERFKSFSKEEMQLIKEAFELAYIAHKPQVRKGGGPYITHPISVARIIAEDFQLEANPIMAAFLHDVVEDTKYTIEDIRERFGDDVAFLVSTVTKEKKEQYEMSKQLDNYKQMLESIHYDIRALLIKLADRLHNMRTLSSMRPDKQMKIAGETDYFYAPLANRLGLYNVKTDLENLSMQYRCPQEFADIKEEMEEFKANNDKTLQRWCAQIKSHIQKYNIEVNISIKYCSVYTIWTKMQSTGSDFKHISHKYSILISFKNSRSSEKDECLKIYSALTDLYKELPASIHNYIDSPKENGYQAFHLKVLSPYGVWEKVHIASERMIVNSRMGCITQKVTGINDWIGKFKDVLKDMAYHDKEGGFMDNVITNFYNDDILVFTPKGNGVVLPTGSTAIDFAYEIHSSIGNHAQYARINGAVATMKTVLKRGDCVEIGTNPLMYPKKDWLEHSKTYKAKRHIQSSLKDQDDEIDNGNVQKRCPNCSPLPGDEVIGFKLENGDIITHKRNCPEAVKLASQHGDNIINIEFKECSHLYIVSVNIKAIDRYHLLSDLVNVVTEDLKLSIDNLVTTTVDEIVDCTINFSLHSVQELHTVIEHIKKIKNVEEVKRIKLVSDSQTSN
ncbi:MAG: HD domain-containing protein [Rikenellaceae bacterium]